MPMHAPLPFEDAMRNLRIRFEDFLVAEAKAFGGIPIQPRQIQRETRALREAIAVALEEYGKAIAP